MRAKGIIFTIFFFLFSFSGASQEELTFSDLNPQELASLMAKGSLLLVRFKPDGSLNEVIAGIVINGSREDVWNTLVDFDHYAEFMPQTTGSKIISKKSDLELIMEQRIEVPIWSVIKADINYQLEQKLEPMKSIKFKHVSGDLPGTHGGWELIDIPEKNQTIVFYRLYSNLFSLAWPVGPILKSQPDFMTAVNLSTGMIVVKGVKKEVERRCSLRKQK